MNRNEWHNCGIRHFADEYSVKARAVAGDWLGTITRRMNGRLTRVWDDAPLRKFVLLFDLEHDSVKEEDVFTPRSLMVIYEWHQCVGRRTVKGERQRTWLDAA